MEKLKESEERKLPVEAAQSANVEPNQNQSIIKESDETGLQKSARDGNKDSKSAVESVTTSTNSQPVGVTGQFFSILFSGSIEHGYFGNNLNDVYCKYSIVYGTDWMLAAGMDVGISQISRKRDALKVDDSDKISCESGTNQFVWNLPIDVSFRSYNPYGWPQLVLSVYYFDTFGQDVILGYGCLYLPVTNRCPAMYKRIVRIYAPESSSYLRRFFSWLTGRKPELINSKLFANGSCREALHMVSVGHIELVLNVTFKDMMRHGFRY